MIPLHIFTVVYMCCKPVLVLAYVPICAFCQDCCFHAFASAIVGVNLHQRPRKIQVKPPDVLDNKHPDPHLSRSQKMLKSLLPLR